MSSTRKRKRPFFQSNTVPEQDEVITRVEVVRSAGRRIRTSSTKVSVPVSDVPSLEHGHSQTPELPSSIYGPNLDNPPDPVTKKPRKGLTRSITVRALPFPLSAAHPLTILSTEQTGAVASIRE